jgi:hypothetical protein
MKILNSFLEFPFIQSVYNVQHYKDALSSYRLISKFISCHMCFTYQNDVTLWCMDVVILQKCRDCSQSVPTAHPLSVFHHHSTYTSHFPSGHAAVNITSWCTCLESLPSHHAGLVL